MAQKELEHRSLWRDALTHLAWTTPRPEDVAAQAYAKYLLRGDQSNDPLRDWLEAEAELRLAAVSSQAPLAVAEPTAIASKSTAPR
jgi:hypothetical protein